MAAWEKLKGRFKAAKELEDQNEEDLGDIPDE
jgi:ubiquitin conjugation factor E4 B